MKFCSVSKCVREHENDIQSGMNLTAAASATESEARYPARTPAPVDMFGLGWSLMVIKSRSCQR
jgi:hypothetical protein